MESDQSLLKILSAKSSGTCAIFDRGDYYSVFQEDARFLAAEVFRSDVCLKSLTILDNQMCYLTMSSAQYQRIVRELLILFMYRVELYVVEDGIWKLKAKGTVGNLGDFEEIVGEASGSTVMAISVAAGDSNAVSVAFLDSSEMRLTTAEFVDSSHFAQVELCIVALCPRECVVVSVEDANKKKTLSTLLKRTSVMETKMKDKVQKTFVDVVDLVKQDMVEDAKKLSDPVKNLLCCLYQYLKMYEQKGLTDQFKLSDYKSTGFMHIDAAAIDALELFSLSYLQDSSTSGTLYGHLNRCKTAAGQKLLRDWIARPLCDIRRISERLDIVSALLKYPLVRESLHESLLPRVPDLTQLSRKLLQSRAKLQDCYRIYQFVRLLNKFQETLQEVYDADDENSQAVKELLLEPVCLGIAQFEQYVNLVRTTIDVDYFEKNGVFRIDPKIDPELEKFSNILKDLESKAERARAKMASSLHVDSLKLDFNSQLGYFYRVVLKDEKKLRDVSFITIIEAHKGAGVKFSDKSLKEINEEYKKTDSIYQKAQEELEKSVITACCGYASDLQLLSASVAAIDVLVSFATVAAKSSTEYVKPELRPTGSGFLELKACRHPVLEYIQNSQFIPNDVDFGKDRLIVLTGANMGGKSTYLRSAALTVLMAQTGCFVPCSQAKISVVDGIFTRVGASDQQTRGISTFMAEMLDSSAMLEKATADSLVIVDELGRGTSTFDGFGLAWAIAEDLLKRVKCFCLFATHFHEMGRLADEEGCVAKQMMVVVDNNVLSLLYQVHPGVAQSSFGINVAHMVGFAPSIIENAEKTLKQLEQRHTGEKSIIEQIKGLKGEELRQFVLNL